MSMSLTERQQELLAVIREHIAETGIAPSIEEMRAATGMRSKSGVHRLLVLLEDRGAIRRLPAKARAIEIVDPDAPIQQRVRKLEAALILARERLQFDADLFSDQGAASRERACRKRIQIIDDALWGDMP